MDGYSGSVVFSPQTFRLRSTDLPLSNPSYCADGAEHERALCIGSRLRIEVTFMPINIPGGGRHHAE